MFKFVSFKSLVLLFIFIGQIGYAQVKISAIEITGNKKTRDYIVKRELPYKVGDLLSKKPEIILLKESCLIKLRNNIE